MTLGQFESMGRSKMYNEKIVDVITGEEIIRQFTESEIAKIEEAQLEAKKIDYEIQERQKARLILLEKLGITEEEAKLLLG